MNLITKSKKKHSTWQEQPVDSKMQSIDFKIDAATHRKRDARQKWYVVDYYYTN